MEKKALFILKIISLSLYILLCLTMFTDIENRLIEKLNTINLYGLIITILGIGTSIFIYILRLKQENERDSISNIYRGCALFLASIIINLMDAHIISTIFYFFIRITLGYIFEFIHYAIYTWAASLALKIGLGVFVFCVLWVIYIAIMYCIMLPRLPIVNLFYSTLKFIIEIFDGDSSSIPSQGNSYRGESVSSVIERYAEEEKRSDIRRAADELEKIRVEVSKK
mgnify:CR=1 FL=1